MTQRPRMFNFIYIYKITSYLLSLLCSLSTGLRPRRRFWFWKPWWSGRLLLVLVFWWLSGHVLVVFIMGGGCCCRVSTSGTVNRSSSISLSSADSLFVLWEIRERGEELLLLLLLLFSHVDVEELTSTSRPRPTCWCETMELENLLYYCWHCWWNDLDE